MRTGPDLADIGTRQKSTDWHYNHLFDPQLTSPGSVMPPFRFLFEEVPVKGERSPDAVKTPEGYAHAARPGYQWVPTQRARDLVQYLLSLKLDYSSPESKLEE
jgi:cytochrome c oxidase cbb3-type subunit 2